MLPIPPFRGTSIPTSCEVTTKSHNWSKEWILLSTMNQWIFQVPVKGGRDYITP